MMRVLYAGLLLTLSAFGCSKSSPSEQRTMAEPELVFMANLPLENGLLDIWGYVDPTTGKEYALVGYGFRNPNDGVYIVDVTNPADPTVVSQITTIPGQDIKTWQNYMYTVTGSGSGNGSIVDITNPVEPVVLGSFPSAHNLFISENGYMFLESPGLRIFDLNPDPLNPVKVWEGGKGGHDATVVGNRLYDFSGTPGTNIFDISDPTSPQLLGAITDPRINFHHSGWPTKDGHYLYVCDEGAFNPRADITVWDISNPADPQFVTDFIDTTATVHNLYIIDDYAFVSYYSSGLRIFDISDPASPILKDEFDTSALTGDGFMGAFGVYPFVPSETLYISDMEAGLYLFSFKKNINSPNPVSP